MTLEVSKPFEPPPAFGNLRVLAAQANTPERADYILRFACKSFTGCYAIAALLGELLVCIGAKASRELQWEEYDRSLRARLTEIGSTEPLEGLRELKRRLPESARESHAVLEHLLLSRTK